jgi:hypothetical protein
LQRRDRGESAGHPHRPRLNSPTRRDTRDRPFDEAVELMNEWLTRHKTTRDLRASDGERVLD